MSVPVGVRGFGQAGATVASAGTTIADAAQLNGPFNVVTGTSGSKLPDLAPGEFCLVHSDGGAHTCYPHSATGKINDGAAGAGVTVAANETALLFRLDDTNWWGGVMVTF